MLAVNHGKYSLYPKRPPLLGNRWMELPLCPLRLLGYSHHLPRLLPLFSQFHHPPQLLRPENLHLNLLHPKKLGRDLIHLIRCPSRRCLRSQHPNRPRFTHRRLLPPNPQVYLRNCNLRPCLFLRFPMLQSILSLPLVHSVPTLVTT